MEADVLGRVLMWLVILAVWGTLIGLGVRCAVGWWQRRHRRVRVLARWDRIGRYRGHAPDCPDRDRPVPCPKCGGGWDV